MVRRREYHWLVTPVAVVVVACPVVLSCADGESRTSFDGSDGGSDAPAPNGAFEASTTPCEDSATHVYVLSDRSELYRFRPGELKFEKVGLVSCDPNLPNSMAVDRFGTAWVNYKSGTLYRVSTRNTACLKTDYAPLGAFASFGSAFATNGPGSTVETLFADGNGGTLSKFDLTTLKTTKVGSYTGSVAGLEAELSGTGDGRLYGFFTTKPNATLAKIDPITAATSEPRVLDGVATGAAYAFSFWGGDFWFYTSQDTGPSTVTRLRTADDELEVVIPKAEFRIVGAGVSTCAPLTPPR
jgi:hypothetical protein